MRNSEYDRGLRKMVRLICVNGAYYVIVIRVVYDVTGLKTRGDTPKLFRYSSVGRDLEIDCSKVSAV